MGVEIDKRIVELSFDNSGFDSNVRESLKTLDGLQEKLKFKDGTKGINDVNDAAKKMNFDVAKRALDEVKVKFSAFEVAGMTAITNITNSVMGMATRITSALTIDPIKTGFSEYETQINAIQTILANTSHQGTNLEQVNAALDELNKYADMTIYNFTEMTRNIGTFTAAGVDLDTSTAAIKGIANLAAISGSTSAQASNAMYQLSQALAAGRVSLQDWNSVVNAGMGGKVFQDALKNTAKAMGIVVDESTSFRESISAAHGKESWLTSDVLLNTLKQFTGDMTDAELAAMGFEEAQIASIQQMAKTANSAATDVKTVTQLWDTLKETAQSGWTQTWELIVGDFETSKKTLSAVSNFVGDIINKSAEARNAVLSDWNKLGGRTLALNGLKNIVSSITDVVNVLSEAFRNVFPPITGDTLFKLSFKFLEFTKNLKLSDETLQNLRKTFEGIFTVLKAGLDILGSVSSVIFGLLGSLGTVIGWVLSGTAAFSEWTMSLQRASDETNIFSKLLNFLREKIESISKISFVKPIVDEIKKGLNSIQEFFSDLLSGIDIFNEFEGSVSELKQSGSIFEFLGTAAKKLVTIFFNLGSVGASIVSKFADIVGKVFANFDFESFVDLINSILVSLSLINITGFTKSLSDLGSEGKNVTKGIKGFLGALMSFVKEGQGSVKAIKNILDGVGGSLEAWQSNLKSKTLLTIAGAIAILTASLIALTFVDEEKLFSSLTTITGLFIDLFGTMTLFQKISKTGSIDMTKTATALISLSVAVLILSAAVKNLASLSWSELARGLAGVTAMMLILVGTSALFDKNSKYMRKTALSLILFGAAMNVLANAVETLSALSVADLTKGLVGVGVLCVEIAAFMKLISGSKMGIGKSTGLILLATSLLILSKAVESFSSIDADSAKEGLISVGLILAEIAVFLNTTGDSNRVISTSLGLTILGSALLIFASVVEKLGNLSIETLAKGLISMGVSLGIIVAAINMLSSGALVKALSLAAVAGVIVLAAKALSIFIDVIARAGQLSLSEIGKGFLVIGGALLSLVAALKLMQGTLGSSAALLLAASAISIMANAMLSFASMSWADVIKSLVSLAGTLTVVGVAGALLTPVVPTLIGLAGAIALLGAGCLAAGIGVGLLAASLLSLSVVGTAGIGSFVLAITSIIGLIPVIFSKLGEGIVELAKVLGEAAPTLMASLSSLLIALVGALVESVPVLVEGLFVLINALLSALVANTPTIVDQLCSFIIGIIQAIAARVPDFIQAGFDLLMSFFIGLAEAFKSVDFSIFLDALKGVGILSAMLVALGALTVLMPAALIAAAGLSALLLVFRKGIIDQLPALGTSLSAFMTSANSFIEGAKSIDPSVASGMESLAKMILILTAADVLNGLTSWFTGGNSLEKFGEDLANFAPYINEYYQAIKGIDSGIVESSANAAQALATIVTMLPSNGGVSGLFTGSKSIADFGKDLVSFGESLYAYYETTSGIDYTAIEDLVQKIKETIELGGELSSSQNGFKTSGESIIIELNKGIKDKESEAVDTIMAVLTEMSKQADDFKDEWYSDGAYLVDGLIEGMLSKKQLVQQTASEIAQSTVTATKETLDIHSPSKVFAQLGDFTVRGYYEGMTTARSTYKPLAKGLGTDVIDTTKEALDISGGTSGEAQEIGETFSESVGKGIEDDKTAEEKAKEKAQKIVDAFQKEFDKLDLGAKTSELEYNLWETLNGSASDTEKDSVKLGYLRQQYATQEERVRIAEKEYKEMVKSFGEYSDQAKESYNKLLQQQIDLAELQQQMTDLKEEGVQREKELLDEREEIIDLEYQLWEKQNQNTATEGQKAIAEYKMLSSKYLLQTEKLKDAKMEYDQMVAEFGQNAENTHDAYKTLLEQQIELTDLANQLSETRTLALEENEKAYNTYKRFLRTKTTSLKRKGYSEEEIEEMALKESGYQKDFASTDMSAGVKDAVTSSMTAVKDVYVNTANTTFSSLTPNFVSFGETYITSMGTGMANKQDEVVKQAETISNKCVEAITKTKDSWSSAAVQVVNGFISGISSRISAAASAAAAMARAAYEAAMAELDINSPSRKFIEIGRFADLGFAEGLKAFSFEAEDAAIDLAKSSLDSMNETIANLYNSASSYVNDQPVIRPVLDISDITRKTGKIDAALNRKHAMSIDTSIRSKTSQSSNSVGQNGDSGGVVNQFVQNNYSPKSLSRIEIYRQTKNLLSMKKGGVR